MNRFAEVLCDYFLGQQRVAVAFSGGVDSTLLAVLAARTLGENAVAITVKSPYIPEWEMAEAKSLANEFGLNHEIIEVGVPEIISSNPPQRCYLCKKEVFGRIITAAKARGIDSVVDGTNIDDLKDYRPGLKALAELGVESPLKLAAMTKQDVRELSRELGLPTWDKPAYACLLTRLPYGAPLEQRAFQMIEQAEVFMMKLGFRAVRVRKLDDLAKIEVDRTSLPRLLNMTLFDKIVEEFLRIGFKQVALDMHGYRTGSMNDSLRLEESKNG